jgi:peptide/nickel transport system permease protein
LKRLLSAVPVLVVVAVTVFTIMSLTPGDPAMVILGEHATPEQAAELRRAMGLDQPLVVQFGHWLAGVVTGDLGFSYFLRKSVVTAIGDQIAPTFYLAVAAQLLAVVIAVPAGIVAARHQGSASDNAVMTASLLGVSIPSFLTSLLLVLVFAVGLRWFPAAGYVAPTQDFRAFLTYLTLPAVALAGLQAALIARMTRSAMLDALGMNYVTAAKAKGLSDFAVTVRHAFRNAAIPVLTVIGQTFGGLVAGAVVVETVFNIPGIGQLVANSVLRRDIPTLQGIVLLTATLYVAINLIVDILYGLLDPRVRATS